MLTSHIFHIIYIKCKKLNILSKFFIIKNQKIKYTIWVRKSLNYYEDEPVLFVRKSIIRNSIYERKYMMVTINDIARQAGVAKSTVSRFLNGGSISQRTANKINEIIQETGYIPNAFAQSLKAKNSKLIGIILPKLNHYISNKIIEGIEMQLRQNGYRITMINTNRDVQLELEALRYFQVTKMEGIVCMLSERSEEVNQLLENSQIPVVVLEQQSWVNDAVYFNERLAGQLMAEYLYTKGHRVLHFLSIKGEEVSMMDERTESLKNYFLSYKNTTFTQYEVDNTMDSAYYVTKQQILSQKPPLIVGATDYIALGAMKACLESGIRVPIDVSIAGFGNYPMGELVFSTLTTIDYPYEQAGRLLATHLLDVIYGVESTVIAPLDPVLVERDSVASVSDISLSDGDETTLTVS